MACFQPTPSVARYCSGYNAESTQRGLCGGEVAFNRGDACREYRRGTHRARCGGTSALYRDGYAWVNERGVHREDSVGALSRGHRGGANG